MGRRTIQTAELEVCLLREGILESRHRVQATVCDTRGRAMLVAGNPETATFVRSALKPFQALAAVATGTLERFELNDRDLAIMCSSHKGAMEQVRQAFNILWKADVEPSALQCPIPPGKKSELEYNCSGKHAGMLAVCRQRNWPMSGYMQRNHPVQQLVLQLIAELLKMPPDEIIGARDDCGVPTYYLQMSQMAGLYASLSSGDNLDLERIVRSMVSHPQLIAGDGQFDTELMRLTSGDIVSKAGAEGVQCLGRNGEGMGLAIKVNDGSSRAKYAAAIHILQQLGWISPAVAESLSETFMTLSSASRLEVTGELKMA